MGFFWHSVFLLSLEIFLEYEESLFCLICSHSVFFLDDLYVRDTGDILAYSDVFEYFFDTLTGLMRQRPDGILFMNSHPNIISLRGKDLFLALSILISSRKNEVIPIALVSTKLTIYRHKKQHQNEEKYPFLSRFLRTFTYMRAM